MKTVEDIECIALSLVGTEAIRQFFLLSSTMMEKDNKTPAEHVREMLDYAGTTAADLLAMQDLIAKRLDAAVAKTREMPG